MAASKAKVVTVSPISSLRRMRTRLGTRSALHTRRRHEPNMRRNALGDSGSRWRIALICHSIFRTRARMFMRPFTLIASGISVVFGAGDKDERMIAAGRRLPGVDRSHHVGNTIACNSIFVVATLPGQPRPRRRPGLRHAHRRSAPGARVPRSRRAARARGTDRPGRASTGRPGDPRPGRR